MDLPVNPPVAPMLVKPVGAIPAGAYVFGPKWDGFRSIVFRDGDEVEIGSRNEKPMTRYFPELVEACRANLPPRCVVDGETVPPAAGGVRARDRGLAGWWRQAGLRRPAGADPPGGEPGEAVVRGDSGRLRG